MLCSNIAAWNVRTLLDREGTDRPERRTALIAAELKRYNVDIAALSETRIAGEGSLEEVGDNGEGYTYFWKGLPDVEQRIHGVAFAVRTALLRDKPSTHKGVNERLIQWRIPLKQGRYLTLIGVYAPTLVSDDVVKDDFYGHLQLLTQTVPKEDKLIILGDFNARVGSSKDLWEGVIGDHRTGKRNENGLRLLTYCASNELSITNTMFKLKDIHKTSWMHPRSKLWHLLDYVIVRQRDRHAVLITRAMRGAVGYTDHNMIRTKLKMEIKPKARLTARAAKLNTGKLKFDEVVAELRDAFGSLPFSENCPLDGSSSTAEFTDAWNVIAFALLEGSMNVLGKTSKKNRDWFDEQRGDIQVLLEERNKAQSRNLQNPSDANRARYVELRAHLQWELRQMENDWWTRLWEEIQGYTDRGNQQDFYSAVRIACGPRSGSRHLVRSEDGADLITERSEILQHWAEHYRKLLNFQRDVDMEVLQGFPCLETVHELN